MELIYLAPMIQHVDALGRLLVYYKEDHALSTRECIQESHSPGVFPGITVNYVLMVQLHIFTAKANSGLTFLTASVCARFLILHNHTTTTYPVGREKVVSHQMGLH